MKHILVLILAVLLTCLFSACGNEPEQFTVIMQESYAQHEPVTLTVTLPTDAKESEITFTVDGKVYSVASIPTVSDPTFVFADLPDDGSPELCFTAADGDFTRLREYLGSN